ncbi:MAG: GrpB family protein [Aminobacterium sp.]|nr:GrpB family protein [Aminobacterium sp.]
MEKDLKSMSNEELWALFPIILKEHNPEYARWYLEEKLNIMRIVKEENIERINHIGSTSVQGLVAKPTIDILLEIRKRCDSNFLIHLLENNEYIFVPQPDNPPPHMMFMKGYTLKGFAERVFHLHVRYLGDWNELYFRDYLLTHANVAEKYGRLKERLKKEYEHDRDKYTEAKTEFIMHYTNIASKLYAGRYDLEGKCCGR